jgi:hypothetical protein
MLQFNKRYLLLSYTLKGDNFIYDQEEVGYDEI